MAPVTTANSTALSENTSPSLVTTPRSPYTSVSPPQTTLYHHFSFFIFSFAFFLFLVGGLVFGNSFGNQIQYHEWISFISDTKFLFRSCTRPNAARNCPNLDEMITCSCQWLFFFSSHFLILSLSVVNNNSSTSETCQVAGSNITAGGVHCTRTFFPTPTNFLLPSGP